MPVAGPKEKCEPYAGGEEPLVTGLEDADSPGAITAADLSRRWALCLTH